MIESPWFTRGGSTTGIIASRLRDMTRDLRTYCRCRCRRSESVTSDALCPILIWLNQRLRLLQGSEHWLSICAPALTLLNDCLDRASGAVDYRRRRILDTPSSAH
jgi:hypothetical protein